MFAIWQVALAYFRERARRFSFLVIIALASFLGYQVIIGTFELRLGSYRGLLNTTTIGALTVLNLTFFISIIGFYLLRGNVEQDRRTEVGQFLAATPLSKFPYALGKFLSNTAVLLIIAAVLALTSLMMQLIHGEDKTMNLYQLWMPFVVLGVPVVVVVAATAIFFECTPFLRASAGNVIFFFLWLILIPFLGGDLLAFSILEEAMTSALQAQAIENPGGLVLTLRAASVNQVNTFVWSAVD